jgi:hypothetical protein
MLTDPQIVLKRLERYPNLNFVRPTWVQTAAAKRSVGVWHPFFEDDEASSNQIMGNLDKVIGYLLQEKVNGTRTRAKHLGANTKDEFWSSLTELVQGAKLRAGYPMRYLPGNGPRAPDIELATHGGLVYVEITAMHKTWDFHAISQYIRHALSDLRHSYRIGVECRSDTMKLPEEVLNDLAEQVKTHIVAEPYPSNTENKRVFRSSDGQVAVDIRRSEEDEGYTLARTQIGGRSPDAYFGQIMTRLQEKGSQVAGYRPCVVVVELANAAGDIAVLGSQDKMWNIYSPLFRVDEIPAEIDFVILTWQSIFGETWGHARVLRNPGSLWARSPDAEKIYLLIAGDVGVLASVPATPT